jgi:hypothetical protein
VFSLKAKLNFQKQRRKKFCTNKSIADTETGIKDNCCRAAEEKPREGCRVISTVYKCRGPGAPAFGK